MWNQTILSITGDPEAWRCHSHGSGCPSSANAAPPVAGVIPADTKAMVANPSKCRPTRLFDIPMPLALPFTKSPRVHSPISGKNADSTRPSDKPPLKNTSKRNSGPDRSNAEIKPLKP